MLATKQDPVRDNEERTGRDGGERSISYSNSIPCAHFPTTVRDELEAIKITLLLLRSEPKQSQD